MRIKELLKFALYFQICLLVIAPQVLPQEDEQIGLDFSHIRGFYKDNFDLTISTSRIGLRIKYTKDGTDPITSATAQSGVAPVTIAIDPANTTDRDLAPGYCVRAVAMQADTAVTAVQTHTYLFVERIGDLSPDGVRPGPGWPAQNSSTITINYGLDRTVTNHALYRNKIISAFLDIPSISMVLDLKMLFDSNTGIYMKPGNRGIEWERPCSLELLHPDGRDGFQINAGVRIRGGYSRSTSNPKHAFRFFFRKDYGAGKLKYPLFGDEGVDEFDNIDLRTSQNNSWSFDGAANNTMNRDVFSRDCQRDMGQPYTRSRYYHLYINGTYWGVYQSQERSEASFGASYFGGEPEDYDAIKASADIGRDIEATDGQLDAYQILWQTARDGVYSDSSYYYVQGRHPDGTRNPNLPVLIDLDNLIDYMLIIFITGNFDAPVSWWGTNTSSANYYALYNRNGQDGFLFFQHDAEHTIKDDDRCDDRTGPYPAGTTFNKCNPQWLNQQFLDNARYRALFADRVHQHFGDGGALSPAANIARFMQRKEELDLAIIAESARWGDSKHEPAYTRDAHWLPEINWVVEHFFPNRTQIVLDQLKGHGWYPQVQPPRFNVASGRVVKGAAVSLSAPQGTVYYTVDGMDPFQPDNDYSRSITLVDEKAAKRVVAPTGFVDTKWRGEMSFDDSAWRAGHGVVGYENASGYESDIDIDVQDAMLGKATSCFIRIPFTLSQTTFDEHDILLLQVRYDDGFVAYVNGWRAAAALAPGGLDWDSQAQANHEADAWETFDVSDFIKRLHAGENLLAIHGLNVSNTSSDFLISARLLAAKMSNSGRVAEQAIEYSRAITIDQTTRLRARALSNDDWSAAAEVTLYVLQDMDNLKITEMHYHPLDQDVDMDDDGLYEFIELKNVGETSLDLSGLHFGNAIRYLFPYGTSIAPHAHLVLASNDEAFRSRYGFSPFGQYAGQLDNSGERVTIVNADGDTLLRVEYDDRFPWPGSVDGDGYSMVAKELNPYRDQNDAAEWVASSVIHGTPGADDFVATAVTDGGKKHSAPAAFHLQQNYPNPFNPSTTIAFTLPKATHVRLEIYNILGQRVQELIDARLSVGEHCIHWNGETHPAGIYLYQLRAGDVRMTKKMTLIR